MLYECGENISGNFFLMLSYRKWLAAKGVRGIVCDLPGLGLTLGAIIQQSVLSFDLPLRFVPDHSDWAPADI